MEIFLFLTFYPLVRPPEVEKRIAGTKAKAVGAVLRHGHNSQRARARKAANEAGQSNLLKIIVPDLGDIL